MLRSGFGRKDGSLSANTLGKLSITDRSGGFLNLIKSIAGSDLAFCLDAYSIKDVAVGGKITNWYDSLGVLGTSFTQGTEVNKPAFGLSRGKPIVLFSGTNRLTTASTLSTLNGIRDYTIIIMHDYADAAGATLIMLEYSPNYSATNAFIYTVGSAPRAFGAAQYNTSVGYCANGPDSTYFDRTKPVVVGTVMDRNDPGAGFNKSATPYTNGRLVPIGEQTVGVPPTANSMRDPLASNLNISIGAREISSSLPYQGGIGSIIIVKRKLTSSEMSRISTAMMDRYSVSESEVYL